MTQLDRDERQVLAELTAAVNSLKTALVQPKIGNSANISINAGGFGVWVATTACLIMLAALLIGAFWVSREFTRMDTYVSDLKNTNDIQDAYIAKLRAEQNKEKP